MGMTISQKIIATHAGKERVEPGEIVMVKVDVILANELSAALAIDEFHKIEGADRIAHPERAIFVPDHFTPAKDISTARLVERVRQFALDQDARWFEVGRAGIEHCVLPQHGIVGPGQMIIGGDSHTTTYGALGAFSTGVGSTDVAVAWAIGQTWLRVPPSVKVTYHGRLRPWVTGKDLILYTIGKMTVDGATYMAMEFHGETLRDLPMAGRFTMANMSIEAGAKNGIFHVDDVTRDYLALVGHHGYTEFSSDPDAEYVSEVDIDAEQIEPQVAFPSLPENARPVSRGRRHRDRSSGDRHLHQRLDRGHARSRPGPARPQGEPASALHRRARQPGGAAADGERGFDGDLHGRRLHRVDIDLWALHRRSHGSVGRLRKVRLDHQP